MFSIPRTFPLKGARVTCEIYMNKENKWNNISVYERNKNKRLADLKCTYKQETDDIRSLIGILF